MKKYCTDDVMFPLTQVCVCVFTGSEMWLCYHPHGSVLVYRMYASGCDCPTASRPLPYDGHHGGWSGTVLIYTLVLHYVPAYVYTCTLLIPVTSPFGGKVRG